METHKNADGAPTSANRNGAGFAISSPSTPRPRGSRPICRRVTSSIPAVTNCSSSRREGSSTPNAAYLAAHSSRAAAHSSRAASTTRSRTTSRSRSESTPRATSNTPSTPGATVPSDSPTPATPLTTRAHLRRPDPAYLASVAIGQPGPQDRVLALEHRDLPRAATRSPAIRASALPSRSTRSRRPQHSAARSTRRSRSIREPAISPERRSATYSPRLAIRLHATLAPARLRSSTARRHVREAS